MARIKDKIRIIFSTMLAISLGLVSGAYATTEHKEIEKFEKAEIRQVQEETIERPRVEYKAEGLRDPFEALIAKPVAQDLSQSVNTNLSETTPPTLTVQGIIWGGKFSQAIINNKVVKVGERIDGAEIIGIDKNGITFSFKDKQFYLSSPGTGQISNKKPEGGQ